MKYIKNSNYRLLNTKDTYFLVDITEKNYGKSEKILQLNESAKKIWEYLDIYNNEEEIAKGLFNENDNLFSLEEIQDNVKSIIEILGQKGAICDYEPIGLDVEIKANSFGAFKAKMAQFRQPLIGVVEITPYCNFSCPHCYVKGFKNVEVLGIDQYKEIAKILRKKGPSNISIRNSAFPSALLILRVSCTSYASKFSNNTVKSLRSMRSVNSSTSSFGTFIRKSSTDRILPSSSSTDSGDCRRSVSRYSSGSSPIL